MNSITANFTAMLVIAGLILGCTNMKPQDFSDTEPKFELFDYFAGETRAWGLFENRFGTVKRQFHVSITGTIQDEILTLDEKFTYSDGEIDTRIWQIEKKSDSYYEGRANDVVGIAKGIASGNSLNWQYDLNLKALLKQNSVNQINKWIKDTKCKCSFECALAANVVWKPKNYPKVVSSAIKNIGKSHLNH